MGDGCCGERLGSERETYEKFYDGEVVDVDPDGTAPVIFIRAEEFVNAT